MAGEVDYHGSVINRPYLHECKIECPCTLSRLTGNYADVLAHLVPTPLVTSGLARFNATHAYLFRPFRGCQSLHPPPQSYSFRYV